MEKLNLTPDVEATILQIFSVLTLLMLRKVHFSSEGQHFDHQSVHISSSLHVVVQKELVHKEM